jgi:hypothetical protein
MKRKQKNFIQLFVFSLLATLVALSVTTPVNALDYGPNDVIAAVNSLRAEYGLPGYVTSQELNDICQKQADYMASINTLTHDRADGTNIPTTAENIAYGPINVAMNSWIDDQPHFDTLISWSKAQVGAGIAEAGGYVYICLNIRRLSDSEFNQIPFTQGPGTAEVPTLVPTIAPSVEGNEPAPESGEVIDDEQVDAIEEIVEETPIAVLFEEDDLIEDVAPTPEPVEEVIPGAISEVKPQEIAFESRSGKIVAYILIGVGIVGLGGSIYGMLYALRLMGTKKGKVSPDKGKEPKPKKTRREKKRNNRSSQEISQDIQDE